MGRRSAAILAGFAIALGGCRAATEIRVEVSTDLACDEVGAAGIAVGELGDALERAPVSTTSTTCDGGKLGTVVLVPSGDDSANVAFKVYAATKGQSIEQCVADGSSKSCIVARRGLRFIAHDSLDVSVPMKRACEGTPCANDSTCVDGACTTATIGDPESCAAQSCGEGSLGAQGGGGGGGPSDAGADATTSDGAASDGGASDGSAIDAPSGGDAGPVSVCATGGCTLSLGDKFTCAVRGGGVWCWGQNVLDELGRGSNEVSGLPPAPVMTGGLQALGGVTGIVSGTDDTCAFLGDGGFACWGASGVFGPPSSSIKIATPLAELAGSTAIGIGAFHACWVQPTGITCGDAPGASGGKGPPAHDADGGTDPTKDGLPIPVTQIEATDFITCVLTTSGEAWCEGDNTSGEVVPGGDMSGQHPFPPTKVGVPVTPILRIALMTQTPCALVGDGRVVCWGSTTYGDVGADPNGASNQDFNVVGYADGGAVRAVDLATGADFACARLASSEVVCWGNAERGQLGRGGPIVAATYDWRAARVVDDHGAPFLAAKVVAGGQHACAQKGDGSLWCWGAGQDGEITGDGGDQSTPIPVTF